MSADETVSRIGVQSGGVRGRTMASRRRSALRVMVVIVVLAAVAAVPSTWRLALRGTGSLLVAEDELGSAEAIVLLTGIGAFGVLEVVDLVHEGYAQHVALMVPNDGLDAREYARRGLPLDSETSRVLRVLAVAGVDQASVSQLDVGGGGTTAETAVLRRWSSQEHVASLIVVTSRHHSARVRRALEREFESEHTRVAVRIARQDPFDPAHWWERRNSLRIGIVELQKLVLDYVSHPF